MIYRLVMQSHDSRSSNCLLHDLSLAPHTVSDWQKIWQNPNYCPGLSIGLKIFTFEVANSWVWGYACNTNLIYNASSSHQELVWFHLLATLFGGSGALHLRWNQPGLEGLPCFGWTKAESSKCSTKSIIQLPRSATRCKWNCGRLSVQDCSPSHGSVWRWRILWICRHSCWWRCWDWLAWPDSSGLCASLYFEAWLAWLTCGFRQSTDHRFIDHGNGPN